MDPRRWEEIQDTFHQLLGLGLAERAERLNALGATDPALREAVESLVAADAEVETRLAPVDALLVIAAPAAPDPLNLTGRMVSHFQVLEPLGMGGMGVVYRAVDSRLGRTVALKFLLPLFNLDAVAKERFLLEARSAGALDHRNLCTIYEVAESDDGRPFLAMALYEGETLKARLEREGPLPVAEALAVGRQVAAGMACAHEGGIVHRDLKPANVMRLPDGSVKILDFGLAKVRDQHLSGPNARLGTVSYMAPEQVRGIGADPRTDLWSLGVILYETITGARPFAAEDEVATAYAIVHSDPVPPSTLRPNLPSSVEQIIRTLLEKDPARRFADAGRVFEALSMAEQDARLVPGRRGLSRRLAWVRTRMHQRPRTTILAAAVLAVVGVLVAMVLSTRFGEVPLERSVAVLPFKNSAATAEDAVVAAGLEDVLIAQLAHIHDLRVISQQSVHAYALSGEPLHQIGKELGVGRIVEASVHTVGGRLRVIAQLSDARTDRVLWAKQFERERTDLFALQSDLAVALTAALQAKLTTAERTHLARPPTGNSEAYIFYLQGREYQERPRGLGASVFAPLETDVRAAESLLRRAVDLDPRFALAHAQLALANGNLYEEGYDPQPARRDQVRVEAQAALRVQPDLPEAHLAMGRYWALAGDDARAVAEYELARNGLPNDSQVERLLALLHRKMGRWEEARNELESAVRLDPRSSEGWVNLAFTSQAMHRFGDAVRAWDKAIEMAPDNYRDVMERGRLFVRWLGITDSLASALERIPPGFDPDGQITLAWVDLALLRRRPLDALHALRQMRPEFFHGDDYANTSWLRYNRARAYLAVGDTVRASTDFDAAREILERAEAQHPEHPHIHADLGLIYAWLGRKQPAIREAGLAAELLPVSRDAFYAPIMMWHAAETYAHVGEGDTAVALLGQLLTIPNYLVSSVRELGLDPRWDPLRANPRFQELLKSQQPD